VRRETSADARPVSTRKAAAQRVPLPDISASLPSELNSRIEAGSTAEGGVTRIQPSAPIPAWRSQMATAA